MSLPLARPRPSKRRTRTRLCKLACCVPLHCEASDPVWEAYFEARSPAARSMLLPVFRVAQLAAILPPPPGRFRSLQAVAAMLLMCFASATAQQLFVMHTAAVFEEGFQLALHAYIVENLLEVLQTPLILIVSWFNLGRSSPVLAAVLSPAGSLKPAPLFVAFTALIYLAQVASQVFFYVTIFHDGIVCYSIAATWSSFCALVMDRLVSLVLTLAAIKIRTVNRKLSSLTPSYSNAADVPSPLLSSSASWLPQEPPVDLAVQRGVLQSVANRWEETIEQVTALLGHDMLGVALLYSLLQMSIGLVTSSALAVQDNDRPAIRLTKLLDLLIYLVRVASLAVTAGWLYKEAKETETIIGALDTTAWPIRERQRVSHLLQLSRDTSRFRVCGIVSLDHSFLFAMMGNTVTYLVMLLQYPILTPGKAAAVLNQTEAKATTT